VTNQSAKPNVLSSWRFIFALLCISLLVLGGTVQAVHSHPQGDVSHADCALCATAHVVAQVAAPSVTLHITTVVSFVEAFIPPTRSSTLSTFALFTRPPPANAIPA
jgi:hypothetical protein